MKIFPITSRNSAQNKSHEKKRRHGRKGGKREGSREKDNTTTPIFVMRLTSPMFLFATLRAVSSSPASLLMRIVSFPQEFFFQICEFFFEAKKTFNPHLNSTQHNCAHNSLQTLDGLQLEQEREQGHRCVPAGTTPENIIPPTTWFRRRRCVGAHHERW